jgi:hypothetical protein
MINRAKCKVCLSVIESHLPDEIVYCKCGLIAVCDGPAMRVMPFGSPNILRVDDLGNEIVVTYKTEEKSQSGDKDAHNPSETFTRGEAIQQLDEVIDAYKSLPEHAMYSPVTHKDFVDFMLIISTILKRE